MLQVQVLHLKSCGKKYNHENALKILKELNTGKS